MQESLRLTPDEIVFWSHGPVVVNATIVFSWVVMIVLVVLSWLVTRRMDASTDISFGQNLLEVIVQAVRDQIREITGGQNPDQFVPFIGTLFIFIATSNLFTVVPWFEPPTGSLTTTGALALCSFVAVPVFGIQRIGIKRYLRSYIQPTPLMLPFNIISELSRTLALMIRLFGNIMSGSLIAAIIVGIIPLFFPIVMQLLGLLTGMVQAYIFAVLAMVYIASGTRAQQQRANRAADQGEDTDGQ